jgi:hypothetical protein
MGVASTLNSSDMSSNAITITMFVTVNLYLNTQCVGIVYSLSLTNCHMPSSSDSFAITIKLKAKYSVLSLLQSPQAVS